ncbi:MAG TPA: hypothetical protein VFK86_13830 [Bauldia sp.]|nr:hypothetical protein [Bauldia sp.]
MTRFSTAALMTAACLAAGPAVAADFGLADETVVATEAVPPGGWNFRITPYGWLAGMNGTITARGRSVTTSASFIDLVQDSDELIPFMGYFEAGKDRFSIFGDFFYSKIGFSGERTKQVNPVAGLVITATGEATLTTTLTIAQAAAAYDIIQQGGTSLGVYAGARYWNATADVDLKITGEVDLTNLGLKREGKFAVASSGNMEWVDPLVGLRVEQELTERDQIMLLADIGGFGVGSEFSWQVFGGYSHSWQVSRATTMALALGYRILSVDYEEGSGTSRRGLDLVMHGPLTGLSFRW